MQTRLPVVRMRLASINSKLGSAIVHRIFLGALLLSVSTTAATAGSPSAVLPLPTLRPALPISVASAAMPTASDAAQACDLQRVMQITSGKAKAIADGFRLDIYGRSESAGWKSAQLTIADQNGGVATVDFVGCRPGASETLVTPIEVHEGLGLDPATKRIIIRSRTNTITVNAE